MAGASISGLSSGLDTATIIDQLMQVESVPQTRLKSRVATEQSLVTTLQTLNTKVALLNSKAKALAKDAAWAPLVTSSSNGTIGVRAGAGLAPTRLTVTVTSVARTHQLGFTNSAALTDVVSGPTTTVRLDRFSGPPVDIDSGDGTLQGLITAINNPVNATGLHASAVQVGTGQYRLLVESVATGVAEDFTLTASDSSALLGGNTVRTGSDASIDIGAGISITSASNTFAEVVPGLSVTLDQATTVGAVSTITVSRDGAGVAGSVKDLVDSINGVLGEIDNKSGYNTATSKGGALLGDTTVRNLRNALLESIYPANGSSLADVGIQVDRNGSLTFDSAKFAQAYAADPDAVAAQFTTSATGFAERVSRVTTGASDPIDGTLTAAITGRRTGIARMENSIEAWDQRLALRRTTLTRQFTALETALNQMSSQSSWLAGQLSSLPKSS